MDCSPNITHPLELKAYYPLSEAVRVYLSDKIVSNAMAAHALHIPSQQFTVLKAELQDAGQLRTVGRGVCEVSRRAADLITCIPNVLIRRNDEIKRA